MKNVCVFFVLLIGISGCFAQPAPSATRQAPRMLSSETGRFVFGQISDYRRDQYMLDTQTGKLWKIVQRKAKNADGTDAPGDGFEVLDWIPYQTLDGKLNVLPN